MMSDFWSVWKSGGLGREVMVLGRDEWLREEGGEGCIRAQR